MPKMKPTRRTYLLLVVLIALVVYDGYQHYLQQRQIEHIVQQQTELAARVEPARATTIAELRMHLFRTAPAYAYSFETPENESWQQSEQARASAALSQAKYDYIVLPIEQDYRYYDRVTRLMSARWIADALHAATGKRVMSPELALRVLGKRATKLDDAKVADLARQVGAKVVHIIVAHDFRDAPPYFSKTAARAHDVHTYIVLASANGHIIKSFNTKFHDDGRQLPEMRFMDMAKTVVEALVQPASTETASMFDDDGKHPPQMSFADIAQTVVEALVQPASTKTASTSHRPQALPDLPKDIEDMPKAATSPLDNAAYMQLVAMLTPERMQYERRRLFERSLLALRHACKDSPYYNLFTARALLYLYRRPAALGYLSSAKTAAERALREYINGNYPQLAALVPKIKNPLLRAMSYLDLKSVGYAYHKTSAGSGITLPVPTAQWSALLISAGRDGDIWYAPDNVKFFADLKGLFPTFDTQLVNALEARVASGTYDSYGQNYAVFNSVFKRAFAKDGHGCCAHYGSKLEEADIWSLYHSIAVANLLRKLDRAVDVYGSYSSAKATAEKFEPWLRGNDNYMTLYASALYHYAKQTSGSEREFAQNKAFKIAAQGLSDGGETDVNTHLDTWIYGKLLRTVPNDTAKAVKIPICASGRCDFPSSVAVDAIRGWPTALQYTSLKFKLLMAAAEEKSIDDSEIDRQLKTRFDGAPKKTPFMADRLISSGHEDRAIAMLENTIHTRDASWNAYNRLGELMIDKGEYAEASKAFMKYPAFKDPPSSYVVEIGNNAYEAGAKLFWLGQYKEAEPLLEVSANLDTGSARQYLAIKNLALTRSDYLTAVAAAYQLAQRYNCICGFRDYLTILHLAGMHDQAEAAFRELVPRFTKPDLWESMFVGQRMENKPFKAVSATTTDYLGDKNDYALKLQGAHYLVEQAITDRVPSVAQAKVVSSLDTRSVQGSSVSLLASRLGIGAASLTQDCPSSAKQCAAQNVKINPFADHRIAGFLYSYALLREGKYSASVDAFLDMDKYYSLVAHHMPARPLPYFAMAASADNQTRALATLLDLLGGDKPQGYNDFTESLTRAVIYAGLGRTDDSLHSLVMAHRHYSPDSWRLADGWFEQLLVAESIYHKTRDKRFIDKAVVWAKNHEIIRPQDGWAYAFVARYGRDHADRIRAAAFAEYLDPQSAWLAEVPAAIRRGARAWWPAHNPFKLPENPDANRKVDL